MNRHNFFVKFLNKINSFINSLLERNLNKLNSNNLKNLLINNKIFLSIVVTIILFFSYLSIPNIFNQSEISAQLKKNLLKKLNLEFNFEKKLNYKFLPRPHFITNESSLIFNENKISEINKLKIYVSLENLFSLKNVKVQDVIIEEANFNLSKKNDLNKAANNLYKTMRDIKKLGFKSISVCKIPNFGIGRAINDRLKKASYK